MKRILCLVLVLTMVCALLMVMPVNAVSNIRIGDYEQIGTYYSKPILWRCVDIDENGPLILSDKIICIKPFDAAGDADAANSSHGRDIGRQSIGSNYWGDSNMRSWLNSNAKEGEVNWLCGNPPDEKHVWDGYNEYDKEAGFLTNFTKDELNIMKDVTQKSILSYPEIDAGMAVIGSERHKYNDTNVETVLTNFDNAYAEYVTDKIFLLDVKQLNAVYKNQSILGEYYYIGEPSAECVENSEYKDPGYFEAGLKWHYWIRTPYADSCDSLRYVVFDGTVFDGGPYGPLGVRPAFYLNSSSASLKSGTGSKLDPYSIEGGVETSPTPTQKPTPTPTQKPTSTPKPTLTPLPTAKPTADPSAPSVEITEVLDYIVTAKVNNCDDFDAQVILAVYNKNGALIEMQNYYNTGDVMFLSENLQNADIKVMLWSDMNGIKPLAEPAEMSL